MLLPYLNKDLIEAGCDEAGRGCLAGSVYAAAVILPVDFKNELLNDSKQLTEHQRYALREIVEREALAWAVGVVTPEEIDEIKHAYKELFETGKPLKDVANELLDTTTNYHVLSLCNFVLKTKRGIPYERKHL